MPTWLSSIERAFLPVRDVLHRIERKVDRLMALVSIEQGDLDTIASTVSSTADTIETVKTDLAAILASETTLDPADETALQAAVTKLTAAGTDLQSLDPNSAPPAPVDPTPTPDPTPVDPTPTPDPTPDPAPVDPNPVVDPTT